MSSNSLQYVQGNLFNAPIGSILGHSCNCQGRWGSGVAAAFKQYYPVAYQIYHAHCIQYPSEASKRENLLGKCLLIPPQTDDIKQNYVACLFTSCSYGGQVDPPGDIVKATELAIDDLLRQAEELGICDPINIPKINSGLFQVPWEDTASVLEKSNRPFVVYEI